MVQRQKNDGTWEVVYVPQTATPSKAVYLDLAPGDAAVVTLEAGSAGFARLLNLTTGATERTIATPVGSTAIGPFSALTRVLVGNTAGASVVTTNAGTGFAPVVVSAAAPDNNDGRPDGTVYIQSAS